MTSLRHLRWSIPAVVLGICAGVGGAVWQAHAEPAQVIEITALKFEYLSGPIKLKKGVPVTLAFTTLDRAHGFNLPAFKLRADIVPGQTVKVTFTPDKTGTFEFHCDNFCGDGHEEMTGDIVVE